MKPRLTAHLAFITALAKREGTFTRSLDSCQLFLVVVRISRWIAYAKFQLMHISRKQRQQQRQVKNEAYTHLQAAGTHILHWKRDEPNFQNENGLSPLAIHSRVSSYSHVTRPSKSVTQAPCLNGKMIWYLLELAHTWEVIWEAVVSTWLETTWECSRDSAAWKWDHFRLPPALG